MKTTRILLATLLALLFAPKVHAATFIVTNNADSGAGSLRAALAAAAASPGADIITFDAALNGATISLTSSSVGSALTGGSAIIITDAGGVTIDASSLAAGLTIDDGAATTYRLFSIASGSNVAMHGLTLANGGGSGFVMGNGPGGGAIWNSGTLTLSRCNLSGNSIGIFRSGGAIENCGFLTLTRCTLSGNSTRTGGSGGAIYNAAISNSASLTQCTLSGNSDGAILNDGTMILSQCTFSGNSAGLVGAGAIRNFRAMTLTNNIIAGNTSGVSNGITVSRNGMPAMLSAIHGLRDQDE